MLRSRRRLQPTVTSGTGLTKAAFVATQLEPVVLAMLREEGHHLGPAGAVCGGCGRFLDAFEAMTVPANPTGGGVVDDWEFLDEDRQRLYSWHTRGGAPGRPTADGFRVSFINNLARQQCPPIREIYERPNKPVEDFLIGMLPRVKSLAECRDCKR
jgi:hypothetical protein